MRRDGTNVHLTLNLRLDLRALAVAVVVAAVAVPFVLRAGVTDVMKTFTTGTVASAQDVNANFSALAAAVDATAPVTQGSGWVRIGDIQICWGSHSMSVPANQYGTIATVNLPAGCTFLDTSYAVSATMTGNYGNQYGAMQYAAPASTTSMSFRYGTFFGNAAGGAASTYTAIGRWR